MALSPNEELASKVVAALSEAGLIAPKRVAEVTSKLNSGTAKESEWRFWIEETLPGEKVSESEEIEHG